MSPAKTSCARRARSIGRSPRRNPRGSFTTGCSRAASRTRLVAQGLRGRPCSARPTGFPAQVKASAAGGGRSRVDGGAATRLARGMTRVSRARGGLAAAVVVSTLAALGSTASAAVVDEVWSRAAALPSQPVLVPVTPGPIGPRCRPSSTFAQRMPNSPAQPRSTHRPPGSTPQLSPRMQGWLLICCSSRNCRPCVRTGHIS